METCPGRKGPFCRAQSVQKREPLCWHNRLQGAGSLSIPKPTTAATTATSVTRRAAWCPCCWTVSPWHLSGKGIRDARAMDVAQPCRDVRVQLEAVLLLQSPSPHTRHPQPWASRCRTPRGWAGGGCTLRVGAFLHHLPAGARCRIISIY